MAISLCGVAAGGNAEVMEQLLSEGADPDQADYGGRTPLVWCQSFIHRELHFPTIAFYQLLTFTVRWMAGEEQLIASAKGFVECVKLLLQHNADANKAGRISRVSTQTIL